MRPITRNSILAAVGLLSLFPYLYAYRLQDLRVHTVEVEVAFFAAFGLYTLAVVLLLRRDNFASSEPAPAAQTVPEVQRTHIVSVQPRQPSPLRQNRRAGLVIIFAFAILFRLILIFTPPTLSDDLFRYVWDGRVQAHGINPYAYAPSSAALANLRDLVIYPHINRIDTPTVYPAAAELSFASIWRIVPDSTRWFQIVMATADLLAGGLVVLLLGAMNKPRQLALIYLWSPLVIFETAHSAHLDSLVLPVLVAAWLARVEGRDAWVGALLGFGTALKLYPALLLPVLWRARDDRGNSHPAWQMPMAFVGGLVLPYLPFLLRGGSVIGFLPGYFEERFNMGLAGIITGYLDSSPNGIVRAIVEFAGNDQHVVNAIMLGVLALAGVALMIRPARDGQQAVRRSIWIIGAYVLFTEDLFPWYVLWLVPLLAISLRPGRFGLRLDAWTGWYLFSGFVALSYTFFIVWKPVDWVALLEFGPLYALLVVPAVWKLAREIRDRRLQRIRLGRTPLYPPLVRGEEKG